ncbi:MAG: hypothetical protein ACYDH8_16140 [Syntrophales bacterium]
MKITRKFFKTLPAVFAYTQTAKSGKAVLTECAVRISAMGGGADMPPEGTWVCLA